MGGRKAWGFGRVSGGAGGGAPVEGVGGVAYRARRPPRRVELARAPRQRVHEDGVGVALNLKGGAHMDMGSGGCARRDIWERGRRGCGHTHLRGDARPCGRRHRACSQTW